LKPKWKQDYVEILNKKSKAEKNSFSMLQVLKIFKPGGINNES